MNTLPPMPVSRPLLLVKGKANRRKHTRAWRWAAVLGVIVAAFFTLTCATIPPRAVVIPRPPESKLVAPMAQLAQTQLGTASTTLAVLQGGLQTAVSEADRLRKQKTANEAELQRMWALLTQEQSRAAALWEQLGESQKTVEELQQAAIASDSEIAQLRTTVDTLNGRLQQADKWMETAKPKVAVYDWWAAKFAWVMRKIYWIVGIAIVLLILWAVLKFTALGARFAL